MSPPAGGKTAAESAAKTYQFHGVLPPTCKQVQPTGGQVTPFFYFWVLEIKPIGAAKAMSP